MNVVSVKYIPIVGDLVAAYNAIFKEQYDAKLRIIHIIKTALQSRNVSTSDASFQLFIRSVSLVGVGCFIAKFLPLYIFTINVSFLVRVIAENVVPLIMMFISGIGARLHDTVPIGTLNTICYVYGASLTDYYYDIIRENKDSLYPESIGPMIKNADMWLFYDKAPTIPLECLSEEVVKEVFARAILHFPKRQKGFNSKEYYKVHEMFRCLCSQGNRSPSYFNLKRPRYISEEVFDNLKEAWNKSCYASPEGAMRATNRFSAPIK